MNIVIFSIIWIIGGIVNLFTSEKVRDYKDYSNPKVFLLVCIFFCFTASWVLTYLNIITEQFYIPNWIYHNCNKNSKITFEDTDYDKDGNVMKKYNSKKFGHRETYRVYTCRICGKVRKERLQ